MAINTLRGDLLKVRRGVILHQVNCMGRIGYLAKALYLRNPNAFSSYFERSGRALEIPRHDLLGTAVLGWEHRDLCIAHVFGQLRPGPHTDLAAVDQALRSVAAWIAPHADLPVYCPSGMGCGKGGGNWSDYSSLLTKHFPGITALFKEGPWQGRGNPPPNSCRS